jgi:hypothetical protein
LSLKDLTPDGHGHNRDRGSPETPFLTIGYLAVMDRLGVLSVSEQITDGLALMIWGQKSERP